MGLQFEWDKRKARRNLGLHRVSFEEAATAFADPLSLTITDADHSEVEERLVLLGHSHRNRLLVVVHSERGDSIRIIGARLATRRERAAYEEDYP